MSRAIPLAMVGVLIIFPGGAASIPEPQSQARGVDQPVLALSSRLRGALVAEMVGLRESVAELAVSLTTGEWEKAAAQARHIRDSYIMEQQLSPAELEELHRSLPEEFVALDARLHRHAEELAHAADAGDAELALFYFQEIVEGCVACHSRYATHTLKGFRPAAPPHAH